jgi:hypothetical protein
VIAPSNAMACKTCIDRKSLPASSIPIWFDCRSLSWASVHWSYKPSRGPGVDRPCVHGWGRTLPNTEELRKPSSHVCRRAAHACLMQWSLDYVLVWLLPANMTLYHGINLRTYNRLLERRELCVEGAFNNMKNFTTLNNMLGVS